MPKAPPVPSRKLPTKVLLVGGGTGGHIYPLYNLAETLIEKSADVHLMVNDAELDKKIVQQTFNHLPLQTHYFRAYKWHYHLAFSNLINWIKILKSCVAARHLVMKIQPDVIFFKGGFVGFPILVAAKWLTGFKGKIYLHDSDISTGALSKLFGKYADQTFSNFGEDATPLFYWPRFKPGLEKKAASQARDLLPQILIFGGSQGAQFINQLILKNVDELCKKYRVILVTGPDKLPDRHPKLDRLPSNLEIYEFLDQDKLIEQIICSSLVIARAGASMFQVLAAQKPLITIPLPTAARNHQYYNAKYFADQGLCYLLEQNKNTHSQLLEMIEAALHDQILRAHLEATRVQPQTREIVSAILD